MTEQQFSRKKPWIAKTTTANHERFELHLGNNIHVLSLQDGEAVARSILLLLGIDVSQLEQECERLHIFAEEHGE